MARDVSSPEKGRGLAFFSIGTIIVGGGVWGMGAVWETDATWDDAWVRGIRPSGANLRRCLGS